MPHGYPFNTYLSHTRLFAAQRALAKAEHVVTLCRTAGDAIALHLRATPRLDPEYGRLCMERATALGALSRHLIDRDLAQEEHHAALATAMNDTDDNGDVPW